VAAADSLILEFNVTIFFQLFYTCKYKQIQVQQQQLFGHYLHNIILKVNIMR